MTIAPCPFCNGPASVEIDDGEWDAARVIRRECGATGPWEDLNNHPNQEAVSNAVIARCNARATPPQDKDA